MNILIGDDHVLFREGLRRLLEQVNPHAAFIEANSFEEVLDLCRGEAAFRLILTDLRMPGWPGFSGFDAIRELQPDAPIVVVSASESLADVRAALNHGAAGYIPKSSSVKIMMSALELVFSGGIYVPPAALRGGLETGTEPETAMAEGQPVSGGNTVSLPPGFHQLTQRQLDVLNGLRAGKSNKQIAYELGLSEGTVKIHVTAIFKSLRVRNRTQAAMAYPQVMAAAGKTAANAPVGA
ncbi:MAG TPA: response regulator transcription factor [Azospirillaceae bacterium]|nr:response regulator transcription factor [Azospirillaceae bacterium]